MKRYTLIPLFIVGALFALVIVMAPPQVRADNEAPGNDVQGDGPGVINGDQDPQVVGPQDLQFSLSKTRAAPGGKARVIFAVRTKIAISSLWVAIDFDESILRVHNVEPLITQAGFPALEDAVAHLGFNNLNEVVDNQADEGWIIAKIGTGNSDRGLGVSTGQFVPILALDFEVLRNAGKGFSPIEFKIIHSRPADQPPETYRNQVEELAVDGVATPLELQDVNFAGGGIDIIGEVGFFMRGDANYDLDRDISDPGYTLRFLFMSGPPPICPDAMDSNDDGEIDVSDAIFTLVRLFISSAPFPEPHTWGEDPTPDNLDCDIYSNS